MTGAIFNQYSLHHSHNWCVLQFGAPVTSVAPVFTGKTYAHSRSFLSTTPHDKMYVYFNPQLNSTRPSIRTPMISDEAQTRIRVVIN